MTETLLAAAGEPGALKMFWFYVQIFIGFSFIIFIHELGHFMAAKWAGVRVEQFAVGFFREVFGFTHGETRYSFNLLPLGGYVKMLGQEDFEVDHTGELQFKDDPRSFANKPIGQRMVIISGGVVMNVLLAGALFMFVFLVGKNVQAPRVGAVLPDGPAALAGLQSGDTIKRIDGAEVDEFMDINMAVTLAKPGKPLEIVIERGGETLVKVLDPQRNVERDLLQIGISSPQSATLVAVGPEYSAANPHDPRPGDKIVEIAGMPVTDENANQMMNLLLTEPLAHPQVTVERPVDSAEGDSGVERVAVDIRPRIVLLRAEAKKPENLLGLVPLMRVSSVEPGGRADLAGLRVGDTILRFGDLEYPSFRQINDALTASAPKDDPRPEKDIPIRVRRAGTGEVVNLVVRPKVKIYPITGKRTHPTIQAAYDAIADDVLLVGSIEPQFHGVDTPAHRAGIPAGAVITAVDDAPVHRWVELAEQLQAHAGRNVTLTYHHANQKGLTCSFPVPETLHTRLGLGPEAIVVAVDDQESVYIDSNGNEAAAEPAATTDADAEVGKGEDGNAPRKRRVRVDVRHPAGLWAVLAKHVGQTVTVKYRRNLLAATETAELAVTESMLYPWVGMLIYTADITPGGETILLRKTNPIAALKLGARKTYYFIVQVYQVMERMIVQRSLGVEHVSGPLGIVKMGGMMAEKSFTDLLYFLAIISANLAVINFLPLPIVDGGLMVFLIIEKIKGSPISLRVQVATQIVGLVLIVTAFLFVTIMDFSRF